MTKIVLTLSVALKIVMLSSDQRLTQNPFVLGRTIASNTRENVHWNLGTKKMNLVTLYLLILALDLSKEEMMSKHAPQFACKLGCRLWTASYGS